uniref:Uncharacterized protein n=1 Tax=Oryza brachyantha TaxID=4533 RepID=J3LF82_ORYBR
MMLAVCLTQARTLRVLITMMTLKSVRSSKPIVRYAREPTTLTLLTMISRWWCRATVRSTIVVILITSS